MASSTKRGSQTPLLAVRQVARSLKKDATWDDVVRKLADKRLSDAAIAATNLEPRNGQRKLVERFGTAVALAVLAACSAFALFGQDSTGSALNSGFIPLLLLALEYLFYAVVAYLLTFSILEWILLAKRVGWRRLFSLRKSFSNDSDAVFFVVFLTLAMCCFAMSVYWGFGKFPLIAGWILLVLAVESLRSLMKPASIIFVGPIRQRSLVFHKRAERRIFPLGVMSFFSTGLQGDLGGLRLSTGHNHENMAQMVKAAAKAIGTYNIVVIDAKTDHDIVELLTKIIEASTPDIKFFLTVENDTQRPTDELITLLQSYKIAPEIIAEPKLLQQLVAALDEVLLLRHNAVNQRGGGSNA